MKIGSHHTKQWKENQSKRMLGNKYSLGYKQTQEHKVNSASGRMITKSPSIKPIQQIIEGLILSDAHITEPKTKHQNSRFSISIGWKYRDFAYYLQQLFNENNIDVIMKTYTRKTGYTSINITTGVNTNFTKLREKWYRGNTKIIPTNLVLTPQLLAYWFIGDGHSRWYKGGTQKSEFELCTECFKKVEVEYLQKLLSDLGIKNSWLGKCRNNGYRIHVKKSESVAIFMKIIEPYIIPCFHYKIKHPLVSDIHNPIRKSKNSTQPI